jgi:hypothetical protein
MFPDRLVGGAMYSGSLFAKDPGWFAGGGLFAVQIPGPSGYMPPTKTVHDKLNATISGVHIVAFSAPGETRDINSCMAAREESLSADSQFYQSFPAITTLRGADFRNPLDYIASIDLY